MQLAANMNDSPISEPRTGTSNTSTAFAGTPTQATSKSSRLPCG